MFTEKRIQPQLDVAGLRRGDYSDHYFANIYTILSRLIETGATFAHFGGKSPRIVPERIGDTPIGELIVEMQVFNRRAPRVLVGGVDVALAMLKAATGYYQDETFIPTFEDLEVLAVQDGTWTQYAGNPLEVQPVIKIRGRYRDFALLETPILGILTRVSRIATNVYQVLQVSNGKPVLFFPARFDLAEVQSADGYAYWLAIQRYNQDTGQAVRAQVSTDAQGRWWGGRGSGTIPHALIAAFMADSAAAMVAFAEHISITTPRILLADFNNDVTRDAQATLNAYWPRYREAYLAGDLENQRRWTLNGVRLDTSANMLDAALYDPTDKGVSPALVRAVRSALDCAYEGWGESGALLEVAQRYCQQVQIVVTGGFNRDRIERFESEQVPVDVYGVGSTFLQNDKSTNTDYTMDIVRVQIDGEWIDMAKVGRGASDNPHLKRVNLKNEVGYE
ncbi:MAG: nicotinate phosphoribosyltransferase [Anaerolineae bacterium]|nr:nicotinate phosphoribosyltransferase [Anaerolineae bacterium]